MSKLECKVYKLKIKEHPNADSLEIAMVGDYNSVVAKGQFKTGDLGVYLPEGAVLPDWLIGKIGLVGKLAGPDHNYIKAVKLRQVTSQGIVLPMSVYPFHTYIDDVGFDARGTMTGVERDEPDGSITVKYAPEGTDVTEFLGIIKYEPKIPPHMDGEIFNAHGCTLNYDIENIKKYNDVLQEGEEVVFTEKLHGTWTCFGYHPEISVPIITSKGHSANGLAFKLNEANSNNIYVRMFHFLHYIDTDIVWLARETITNMGYTMTTPVYILGEILGQGVQDLAYGIEKPTFRVFDVYVGQPNQGRFLNDSELSEFCIRTGNLKRVPVLFRGNFTKSKMLEFTDGHETISGKSRHMREGIIITPVIERYHDILGRVKLKSVSDVYLNRKKGTEYQ